MSLAKEQQILTELWSSFAVSSEALTGPEVLATLSSAQAGMLECLLFLQ